MQKNDLKRREVGVFFNFVLFVNSFPVSFTHTHTNTHHKTVVKKTSLETASALQAGETLLSHCCLINLKKYTHTNTHQVRKGHTVGLLHTHCISKGHVALTVSLYQRALAYQRLK